MTARLPVKALALTAICFATAMVGIAWTREAGNVAALWPTNAILLAVLLRSERRHWPAYVLAFAPAVVAANLAFGDSLALSAGLALANIAEIVVALALALRLIGLPLRFSTIREAGLLLLLAGGVAPLFGAGVGASVIHLAIETQYWTVWWVWWASDSMGMLVFLPFSLLVDLESLRRYGREDLAWETGLFLLVIIGVTCGVMYQDELFAPIFIVPVLMAAAARLDRLGTAMAVLLISVIATTLTLDGIGPLATMGDQSMAEAILDLQLLLGALALPALMIAVLFAEKWAAHDALAQSERRYRAFYDRSPVMLYSTDLQGRLISVSDYWVNAMGYERGEVLGRMSRELLTPESRHRVDHEIAPKFMELGFVKDVELQYVKKDGGTMDVLLSAIREEGADGRMIRSLAVLTDISDRKAAETRVREQEARSRAVIHAALDGVMIIAADGTVELFNPAAERIFGYDAAEVIGQDVGMLVYEPDPSQARHVGPDEAADPAMRTTAQPRNNPLERVLSTDADTSVGVRGEAQGRRKDGGIFPMDISVAKFTSGRRQSFVAILHDLTETKHLLKTLEQRAKDLKRSNVDLEQFASAASHDLQEPLRKIQTFGGFLERDYAEKLDEEGQFFLGVIVDGAIRLKALIQDLLSYSAVNRDDASFETVALNAVITDILDDMSVTIEETDAVIEADPLPDIAGNAPQLRQLFQNLIDNAIKYRKSGESPQIVITNRWRAPVGLNEPRVLEICMTDNGLGFDQVYADSIFYPFKRLHSNAETPGTGIGLAICARVAALHGGTIRAESIEGEGTTIVLTLDPGVKEVGDGEQEERRA